MSDVRGDRTSPAHPVENADPGAGPPPPSTPLGPDAAPVVMETHLDLPLFSRGKVRDIYDLGDRLLIVATDRLSAFDCVLPTGIPDKGRVLTGLSAFWFERLAGVVRTHYLATDVGAFPVAVRSSRALLGGRAMLVRRCRRIDIECVVRGYLAGSAWQEYGASGTVSGVGLPAGLRLGSRLPAPLFTPATKAASGHDETISFAQMARVIGETLARRLRDASLALYRAAAEEAERRGFILVDTKFEFGLDGEAIVLIDEVATPDSSRFWDAAAYAESGSTESFDKQIVRDYLERLGWNKMPPAPPLPPDVVEATRDRYREVYRRITGHPLSEVGR